VVRPRTLFFQNNVGYHFREKSKQSFNQKVILEHIIGLYYDVTEDIDEINFLNPSKFNKAGWENFMI